MKKLFFFFILSFLLVTSIAYASDYTDIENHWAKDNIIALSQNSILNGYTDNTFRPDNTVTVSEFIKMIVEAGDYKIIRSGDSVWPTFYIETAKANKLLDDKYFSDYNTPITRYEVIDIISNFIDLTNVKNSSKKFNDIDNAYKDKILKLVNLKIIEGYSDKTFRGNENITRAEVASIIKRSLDNRKKINSKKKYQLEERNDLSNYGESKSNVGVFSNTRYTIQDNKLLIFDNGKYATLDGYAVDGKLINIQNVIKIIKKLINEDSYTAVIYKPSKYTINQLKIIYGESEEQINNGGEDFVFTYYEDKPYELSRILMQEDFSNKCYMKIEVLKLWKDYSEFANENYIDTYKKEKLYDALQIEFGSSAQKILNYIIEKNKLYVTNTNRAEEHTEIKKIGKYVINFYQEENGVPQFYISKK